MIKYLVLLFNLIGLFVYQIFLQSGVTVTQTAPTNADPGSTFTVEVTINKGGATGFAKYQADLPPGFTATAVQKGGATVLASGNAIKYIWASLPGDQTLKISYTVAVDASVSGNQNIAGKFLYVVDNQKTEADANNLTVTIGGAATASTPTAVVQDTSHGNVTATTTPTLTPTVTPTTTQPDNSGQVTSSNQSQPSGDNGQSQASAGNNPTPQSGNGSGDGSGGGSGNGTSLPPAPSIAGVFATRSLSAGSVAPGGTIVVSVTVHKGSTAGFAKLQEIIPDGFTAAAGDVQTASPTFVDNKMKMVWLSLPADSVFIVTYKLTAGAGSSGTQSITGTFSFVNSGAASKYPINATTFSVSGAGAVAVQQQSGSQQQTAGSQQQSGSQQQQTAGSQQQSTSQQQQTAGSQQQSTSQQQQTSQIPNATPNGVAYYVQIMALHNPLGNFRSYFAGRNVNERITPKMEEGFTKYIVGNHKVYKDAHDHRNNVRNQGISDAFVVAYNGGRRTTVQDALMITHDQWYP